MLNQSKFVQMFSLAVLALAVLSACGSQPTAAPAQIEVPATEAQPANAVTSLPTQAASAPAATEQATEPSAAQPAAETVSFAADLQPLLQESCVSCHGGEKTSRGLDLKTYASLIAGSQNGAVLVAGEAATSKLVQLVQSGKMPKRGTKWTADQIQLLVNWVNAGAQNN